MKNYLVLLAAFVSLSAKSADGPGAAKQLVFENAKLEREIYRQYSQETLLIKAFPANQNVFRLEDGSPYLKKLEGETWVKIYSFPTTYMPFQVFSTLVGKLKGEGYEIAFECTPSSCGDGKPSQMEHIYFNHSSAKQNGWRIQDDLHFATMSKSSGGRKQWVSLEAGKGRYNVTFVEEKAAQVNTAKLEDAQFIATEIAKDGKATLYGIYFDFNKATLKPESDKVIAEVASYLAKNPTENLIVTGHADNQGEFEYNVTLSRERAKAVVEALVKKHKVAGARLTHFGAGMAAPVSTNATEAGRALNRRVELVRR